MKATITSNQRQVLEHAADRADERITWFPDHFFGSRFEKLLVSLGEMGLAELFEGEWFITDDGKKVIGR